MARLSRVAFALLTIVVVPIALTQRLVAPTIYPPLPQPRTFEFRPPAVPVQKLDPAMPFQDQPIRFERPFEPGRSLDPIVVPDRRK